MRESGGTLQRNPGHSGNAGLVSPGGPAGERYEGNPDFGSVPPSLFREDVLVLIDGFYRSGTSFPSVSRENAALPPGKRRPSSGKAPRMGSVKRKLVRPLLFPPGETPRRICPTVDRKRVPVPERTLPPYSVPRRFPAELPRWVFFRDVPSKFPHRTGTVVNPPIPACEGFTAFRRSTTHSISPRDTVSR